MGRPSLSKKHRTALREATEKLRDFLGDDLVKLVLFGSRARGDAETFSDIDLAVIVKRLTRRRKRKIYDLVIEVELKHFISFTVLVFSVADFNHLKSRERRIALDIESEGIAL